MRIRAGGEVYDGRVRRNEFFHSTNLNESRGAFGLCMLYDIMRNDAIPEYVPLLPTNTTARSRSTAILKQSFRRDLLLKYRLLLILDPVSPATAQANCISCFPPRCPVSLKSSLVANHGNQVLWETCYGGIGTWVSPALGAQRSISRLYVPLIETLKHLTDMAGYSSIDCSLKN